MENWLVNGVLVSVCGGLIVSTIEAGVRRILWHTFDWKRSLRVAAIITVVALLVLTYCPPYSVSRTYWCLTSQGTTEVRGEVVRLIWRTPVVGVTIQAKLFPAGSDQALQKEGFGTTDWNGRFRVELRPPQPTEDMYLINTAYNYDSPLWNDRWYIKNFRKTQPPMCR